MCAVEHNNNSSFDKTSIFYVVAAIAGVLTGYCSIPALTETAAAASEIFINLLKFVSLPIIFLSIISTASGMESVDEIKFIGKKVIKYTLMTTVMAATVGLGVFVVVDPVRTIVEGAIGTPPEMTTSYLRYVIQVIPSNIVKPFVENNVIGVMFIAITLSLSILALPLNNRKILHDFFSSLYAAIMKLTAFLVKLMPIAVWAFTALFFRDLQQGLEVKSLALYLLCVVLANLVQAIIVLPTLLKVKKLSPIALFKAMLPALSIAFFTKSSAAAVPMAIKCAQENAGMSKKISSFSLPLCTTINMNGCAAFILITVLFVSMSNGIVISGAEMVMWIFIASIAAVGNAGVPMGCFFLSSAILAAMNVPLHMMGVILPFYALIDMLESAINVWSDSTVVAIVNSELKLDDKKIPSEAEIMSLKNA